MLVFNKPRFMTGNEVCAEAAVVAGLGFYAGYPITPSSEIMEYLSMLLPKLGRVFIQMEDEIASISAIIGASLAGLKSMTATSGPGFSLMQENIGFASMAEVPIVVVDVMRGGPSTGLPTLLSQGDVMQSIWGTHGDHSIIVLSPNSVAETYELTIKAFNFAEKYRTPVVLLLDEKISHSSERVVLREPKPEEIVNRKKPNVKPEEYKPYKDDGTGIPPLAAFGDGYRFHVTGLSHDETGFPTIDPDIVEKLHERIVYKIFRYKDEIIEYVDEGEKDSEVVILAYGSISRSARHVAKMLWRQGKKIRFLRPKILWPFFDHVVEEVAKHARYIVVPEQNLGQLVREVERAAKGQCEIVRINKVNGEPIEPSEIYDVVKQLL